MDTDSAWTTNETDVSPQINTTTGGELDEAIKYLPSHFTGHKFLGSGGVALIILARDELLRRPVAIKYFSVLDEGATWRMARSQHEYFVIAGLRHPGIVPIFERDRNVPCRWFAMEPLNGTTLAEEIEDAWTLPVAGDRPSEERLGRLLHQLRDAANTVAYAHTRQVSHLDLKPANILISRTTGHKEPGVVQQVYVLDWGLAKTPTEDAESRLHRLTDDGKAPIIGTLKYMSPEQAHGDDAAIGIRSDVFALGLLLYEVLSGRPAYDTHDSRALSAARQGKVPELPSGFGAVDLQPGLNRIYQQATAQAPQDRYASAQEFVMDLDAWLKAYARRGEAEEAIRRALACWQQVEQLNQNVAAVAQALHQIERNIAPADDETVKVPMWQKQDELNAALTTAAKQRIEYQQLLLGALALDPASQRTKDLLFEHYKIDFVNAERAGAPHEAARYEALMREQNPELTTTYLHAGAPLTLRTSPSGASVFFQRYEHRLGKLKLHGKQQLLGKTPLHNVPLQRGSHLLTIEHPACEPVRYPVVIDREIPWDMRRPGDDDHHPILLPSKGSLAADDCYVPGGFCRIGGDPLAIESLPATDMWVDGFIIKKAPITQAEFAAFIRDLIDNGGNRGRKLAQAYVPRRSSAFPDGDSRTAGFQPHDDITQHFITNINDSGTFHSDWPVVFVTQQAALAYCAWRSTRDGVAWRLPHEIEREKATRGVDGRRYPWGSQFDAAFCWALESQRDELRRNPVHDHRSDISPYGVTGLAGNVRDICMNSWESGIASTTAGQIELNEITPQSGHKIAIRGGSWLSVGMSVGAASRFAMASDDYRHNTGFRLARVISNAEQHSGTT